MISYIFELLRDKPEQEQLLLRLLVNKLVLLVSEFSDLRVMDQRKLLQRLRTFCCSSNLYIHR